MHGLQLELGFVCMEFGDFVRVIVASIILFRISIIALLSQLCSLVAIEIRT